MFNLSKNKPASSDETDKDAATSLASVASPTPAVVPRTRSNSMVQSLMTNQKPSVVSEGFTLRGEIESAGVLHVEGSIIGKIRSDDVNIGNTGSIEGALTCTNLNIKGQLTGTVFCDELVIAPSARVKGDLSYRFLSIGSGASIEGDLVCREGT